MSNSVATQEIAKQLKKLKYTYYLGLALSALGAAPYFLIGSRARNTLDFPSIAFYIALLIPAALVMLYVKISFGRLKLEGDLYEAAKLSGTERLLKTFQVSAPPKVAPTKLPSPKPARPRNAKSETQEQQPSASMSSLSAGAKSGNRTKT